MLHRRHHDGPTLEEQAAEVAKFLAIARDYAGVTAADGHPLPIILKGSERMLATMSGATLVEPRKGPGHWDGRSQGVSVHVPGTRSMRYRIGASHGTFVQGVEKPTGIDIGAFTLTTSRAVFAGSKQTREWAWAKLISVTHASDANWTMLSVSNRQKTSGIAYDATAASWCRFWIDYSVARATGTLDQLVTTLEAELAAMSPAPPSQSAPPAAPPAPSAQWAPDPFHRAELRWWDGTWTNQVSTAGVVTTDPPDPPG